MKSMLIVLLLSSSLLAQSYMGKIEPVQSYTIFAQTNGEIVELDANKEHSIIDGVLLRIDDTLEKVRKSSYEEQMQNYERQLYIKNLEYRKIKDIKAMNDVEKDNLRLSILDIRYKMSVLKLQLNEVQESLKHKVIRVDNLYLKRLFVNKHDYVNIGQKVAEVNDVSKAKIVLYVHQRDIEGLKNKVIYINGKRTRAKMIKVAQTTDDTYVSSYMTELHLNYKRFGQIVKVEFKAPKEVDEKHK